MMSGHREHVKEFLLHILECHVFVTLVVFFYFCKKKEFMRKLGTGAGMETRSETGVTAVYADS